MSIFGGLLILVIIVVLVSVLPTVFMIRIMGGDATVGRVLLANVTAAIISLVLKIIFLNIWIVSFFVTLAVYMKMFKLGFLKTIGAIILSDIITAIIVVAIAIVTGAL